jgi:DNA topoisomerase-2
LIGCYEVIDDTTIEITELPIGVWTRDYKTFLEKLMEEDEIDEFREHHMENRVHFIVSSPKLKELVGTNGVLKYFKLSESFAATQYVLYNHEGKIKRYDDEIHILREYFPL